MMVTLQMCDHTSLIAYTGPKIIERTEYSDLFIVFVPACIRGDGCRSLGRNFLAMIMAEPKRLLAACLWLGFAKWFETSCPVMKLVSGAAQKRDYRS